MKHGVAFIPISYCSGCVWERGECPPPLPVFTDIAADYKLGREFEVLSFSLLFSPPAHMKRSPRAQNTMTDFYLQTSPRPHNITMFFPVCCFTEPVSPQTFKDFKSTLVMATVLHLASKFFFLCFIFLFFSILNSLWLIINLSGFKFVRLNYLTIFLFYFCCMIFCPRLQHLEKKGGRIKSL